MSGLGLSKCFPPSFRLRSKADFSQMRRGHRLTYGTLRFVYLPNQRTHARLGLAVSRKYGNAVRRNRLKRQLRASFREHSIRHIGVDILIIPATGWKQTMHVHQDAHHGLEKIMCRFSHKKT